MGESTWEAIYEVSPTDAGVRHVIANARRMALRFDAGDAGLALYREQLGAAGVSLDDAEATRLSYRIRGGARVVTAFSDDEHTNRDPNLFVLIVDTPGG
jgi:hypothetical protein